MHYTSCPALNTRMSRIAFGSVKLGRDSGVKYPHPFTIPTDSEARSLLACAHDLGINVLDTAPAYGTAEARLGALLTKRDDWLLFSKAGEFFEQGVSSFDFSGAAITTSIETSLRRLCTDYLDGILLHSDGNDIHIMFHQDESIGEAVCALQAAKQAGKVRTIGISVKTAVGAAAALKWADTIMLEYNMSLDAHNQLACQQVLADAHAQNKIVLIKKALASGHAVSDTGGVEAALRFVLMQPASSIVLGSVSTSHWQDNAALVDAIVH